MKNKNDNHPDYNTYLPYWKQTRAFIRGMKDVQEYLQPVTMDVSPTGVQRNAMYRERAQYVNFAARTRNAFVGAIFRKPSMVEMPTALEYLIDNVNGSGMALELLAKGTVTSLIEVGRVGLFTSASEGIAKINTYSAENCKNWQVAENGTLSRVELITGEKTEKHLIIDSNGFYATELYYDGELKETIEPTKFDGKRFTEIPFVFCGSTDNAPDVDDMPLWAIVDVSRGHYQNSADYEDILRYMVPTPAVTVPNKSWMEEMLPNGVYEFGNGAVIPIPEGGNALLLQASENQMHSRAMEQKEAQLVALGARIITGTTGQAETAEAVRIRYSSENSVLDNLVGNASDAIEQSLYWCSEFMGVQGEIKYEMNREYFDVTINPQQIAANMLLLDRGIVAVKDIRDDLRKSGFIADDRTDEDIDGDIDISGNGLV